MRTAALNHPWVLRWMNRRHPAVAGPIQLSRNRIYILPTRQGWGYVLLLTLMLLAALNYGNSLLFILCFWMGGVGFLAMHHTHRNLLGLEITGQAAAPVFAGATARFPLRFTHPDAAPRYGLCLQLNTQVLKLPTLAAGIETPYALPLDAPHRGLLAVPRLGLSTTYPLGLFEAWTWIHPALETVVYPAPAEHAPMALSDLAQGVGMVTAADGEGFEDYRGLRDYRPGDGLRHIAWWSLARERGLLTKQFDTTHPSRWQLNWAQFAAESDQERILALLCRQVLNAHALGAPFSLELPDGHLTQDHGEHHRDEALRRLALFDLPPRAGA